MTEKDCKPEGSGTMCTEESFIDEEGNKRTILSIKLDPFTSPIFLGNCQKDAVNKIPADSFYARLPRCSIADLPGPHSADREIFWDKKVERAFHKLYGGDFTLWIDMAERPDGTRHLGVMVKLEETTEDPQASELSGKYLFLEIGEGIDGDCTECSSSTDWLEFSFLTEGQHKALHLRLLHLFLRSYGTLLVADIYVKFSRSLKGDYAANRWYKEALDVDMMDADVFLNTEIHDEEMVVPILVMVGNSLEAVKRFEDASNLYKDLYATYPKSRPANLLDQIVHLMWRDSKFDEAESSLLCGMQESCKQLGGNTSDVTWTKTCSDQLLIIAHNYYHWASVKPEEWPNAVFIFTFLSSLCWADASCTSPAGRMLGTLASDGAPETIDAHYTSRRYLKSKYCNKKVARKALMKAFIASEHPAGFQAAISKLSTSKTIQLKIVGGHEKEFKKQHSHDLKKEARSSVKRWEVHQLVKSECEVCKKAITKLLCCPCQIMVYCSKDCQRAHWKVHKKTCPWKLAQQEQKK